MTKTENVSRKGWARSCSLLSATAIAVITMFSGCVTDSEQGASAGDWVEPGWVAQFRQDMEEDANAWIACFAEHGVEAVMGPSFTVGIPGPYPTPPGWTELLDQANDVCWERLGQHRWHRVPIDAAAYQRMLDSRDCLIAHGHEIPEPPAMEVWIEGDGQQWDRWNPHREWYEARPSLPRLTAVEWAELNDQCPQPGPFVFGMSGLP